MRCLRRAAAKSFVEEGHHALQGDPCRMSGLVDQVLRDDAVGRGRIAVRVALRRVDLDRLETVAELPAKRLEPLGWTEWVLREAKAEDLASPLLDALLDDLEGAR